MRQLDRHDLAGPVRDALSIGLVRADAGSPGRKSHEPIAREQPRA